MIWPGLIMSGLLIRAWFMVYCCGDPSADAEIPPRSQAASTPGVTSTPHIKYGSVHVAGSAPLLGAPCGPWSIDRAAEDWPPVSHPVAALGS